MCAAILRARSSLRQRVGARALRERAGGATTSPPSSSPVDEVEKQSSPTMRRWSPDIRRLSSREYARGGRTAGREPKRRRAHRVRDQRTPPSHSRRTCSAPLAALLDSPLDHRRVTLCAAAFVIASGSAAAISTRRHRRPRVSSRPCGFRTNCPFGIGWGARVLDVCLFLLPRGAVTRAEATGCA